MNPNPASRIVAGIPILAANLTDYTLFSSFHKTKA